MSIIRQPAARPPRIVVIGGGATGTGIAAQAVQRGMQVTLLERGELGSGTSGRFHGMLHSGARYAVADPAVAAECYQENQRLRKLIPSAITATGGLFVALTKEEAAHGDVLVAACQRAGIPIKEISTTEALKLEPGLNPGLKRAFSVPDGFIDGQELIRLNTSAAQPKDNPAQILTNVSVVGFKVEAGIIRAVNIKHANAAKVEQIECDYVVNAAGVWAGRVAGLAGVKLEMLFDKGTMIIFKDQFVSRVINRCRPENDGDLLVPANGQSIMGTTSRVVADPEDYYPTQEEADVLVREGSAMVPLLSQGEAYRIYSGIRPLQSHGDAAPTSSTRSISRSFSVLDHANQGVNNMVSIIGGKVTLYRRMAEATLDALEQKIS